MVRLDVAGALTFMFLIPNVVSFGNAIRCPEGVKRFSAYGGDDPRSKREFYECNNGVAQIESCQDHERYEQKTERCISTLKSAKRSKRDAGKGKTNIALQRQGLAQNIQLGYLYDARSESILSPKNLWSQESLGQECQQINCTSKFFRTQETTDSFSDIEEDILFRLNHFHVEAELKMSFMGGMIQIGVRPNI
jgi:hypothetical protein